MKTTRFFSVQPKIPEELVPLQRLAENFYFCWHPQVIRLFSRIDRNLWEDVKHNPRLFLGRLSQPRLEQLAADSGFVLHLTRIFEDFTDYMDAAPKMGNGFGRELPIVYLSAEFGISDCLPMYAGGLGILAGDHLKCASDMNLPVIGIGLCYESGYFHQYLNLEGWQQDGYEALDLHILPLDLVMDENGTPINLVVDMLGQPVNIHVWKAQIGRVPMYLLDTNNRENPPETRHITQMLYGGNLENRIKQEILLGVGGARLLKKLGVEKYVCHLNEGHSAFVSLERTRALMEEMKLSFEEAMTIVKASTVFTTHTPVPAGHDYFPEEMVLRYFDPLIRQLGISQQEFLALGRVGGKADPDFCMTVLGFRTSTFTNAVSELHAEVTRKTWQEIWPGHPLDDVPIKAITNGIHLPSWMSHAMTEALERFLPADWMTRWDPENLQMVEQIPDSEIWRAHLNQRDDLLAFVRKRLQEQLRARSASQTEIDHAQSVLDPNALTIGFARRFATYKRGDLLFQDVERFAKILNHPERPVQVILAGKAHPQDSEGKKIIQSLVSLIQKPEFRDRVVFLEDYDINVARYLVRGVDLWLNTPRRPLEACGTSGMKAMANGALNLSVLDGWWDEGYEPGVGWAIGRGEEYTDLALQDELESRVIYYLLENEILPVFYHRLADRIPHEWIKVVKNSYMKLCARFSYNRAMADYLALAYDPARQGLRSLESPGFEKARQLAEWKRRVRDCWGNLKLLETDLEEGKVVYVGADMDVHAQLFLGGLTPEDVSVDLYVGPFDSKREEFTSRTTFPMEPTEPATGEGVFGYRGHVTCQETGKLGLRVRVMPRYSKLGHPFSMDLVYWG